MLELKNWDTVAPKATKTIIKEPGSFKFVVNECRLKQSERDKNKVFFIAELEVTDSNIEDHPVGTTVSYAKDINRNDATVREVREFLMHVAGLDMKDWDDIDQDYVMEVTGVNQPYSGKTVGCVTENKLVGPNDYPYLIHKWYAIS